MTNPAAWPFIPLANQFSHDTLEDATATPASGLNAQVDQRLNDLRSHILGGMRTNLPRLRLAQRATASGFTNGLLIGWDTVIEDVGFGGGAGGYSPATRKYTVTASGSYICYATLRQSSAVQFALSLSGLPGTEFTGSGGIVEGPPTEAGSGLAAHLGPIVVRLQKGNVIGLSTTVLSGTMNYTADPNGYEAAYWTMYGVLPG